MPLSGSWALPVVLGLAAVAVLAALVRLLVDHGALSRAARRGAFGAAVGGLTGMRVHDGDPLGLLDGLPDGVVPDAPVLGTASLGHLGRSAVLDGGPEATSLLWIQAGMDASVLRRRDGTTVRAHGSRGGLADRCVRAVAAAVPAAVTAWAGPGAPPPPARTEVDRASVPLRRVGADGSGTPGSLGLQLPARDVTNPVAWILWLRAVAWAVEDGDDVPDPPSVGFA